MAPRAAWNVPISGGFAIIECFRQENRNCTPLSERAPSTVATTEATVEALTSSDIDMECWIC